MRCCIVRLVKFCECERYKCGDGRLGRPDERSEATVARDSRIGRPPVLYNFARMSAHQKWLCALATLLTLAAHAEPISQLKPTDYVNDFAHVLDQNTIAQLDDICRQVDEKAHAQIAVVTVKSVEGADMGTYAVDLFQKWGVGSKSTNRGILILYAINDRQDWIEVGYGLEPILPDGKVGGFRREAVPLMRAGEYSKGLLLVTTRIASVIARDAGVQLTTSELPSPPPEPAEQPGKKISAGGILLLIVVILIVLFTPLRGVLFWMLFSGMFGGGGRGGGFGGGGGFGSGGGFGGFGGGSTGGGGAGGSW
jgi:uncharacterized protein